MSTEVVFLFIQMLDYKIYGSKCVIFRSSGIQVLHLRPIILKRKREQCVIKEIKITFQ